MNHLESAFTGKNAFWRYLVMIAAVFLAANTIGSIPLYVGLIFKVFPDPKLVAEFAKNPTNLGALGFDPNEGLALLVIPFVISLFTFILLIKPLHNRSMSQTINGTNNIRWNRFFISGFIWTLLLLSYSLFYLKIDPSNFSLNNTSSSLFYLVLVAFLIIPFQAALEEVLFRGYLMQGFAVIAKNRWIPLLFTSILFALLHSPNPEVKEFGFFTMMPQYLLFAIVFGIVTIMDDGIEISMGAHAANNIFLCIFITNSASVLQTPALYVQKNVYPWTEFIGLLISGVIFIAVLALIFKWKNFSLLFGRVKNAPAADQIG